MYNNEDIAKCLYYGWNGAEQWSGFTSREMGIVVTSLAIDYYNHQGNTHRVAQEFIDYIESKNMPNIKLDFSEKNVSAYLTDNNTMQRTPSIQVIGSSSYYLTLNLQNGVTLYNETKGTINSGSVNIYGGDTFYLKAPLTINNSWTSNEINNCKYTFQPLVYRTEGQREGKDLQDVATGLRAVTDTSTTTSLSVNWLSTGNLIIHKVDAENNNISIADTTFEIFDSNGNLIKRVTTNSSGIATLNNVTIGTYRVVEKSTNEYYNVNTESKTVQVLTGDNHVTIENTKKTGYIEINKYDEENSSIKLSNVKFGIYDTSNNLIQTITTNSNGYCKSSELDLSKQYVVKELETNEYYILNENTWNVNLTKDGITDGYTYTLNIGNKEKKGYIEIYKYDKDEYEKHNKKLGIEDVTFGIFDKEGNKIEEIKTNSNGYCKSSQLSLKKQYIVKELKTREEYITNNTEWKINLTENAIVDGYTYTLHVSNEHKKGNLHIEKITAENKRIGLGGVEFELYLVDNDKKTKVGTYYTDSNRRDLY